MQPYDLNSDTIRKLCPDAFRRRPQDSHKGSFGTLGIIGGAEGMSGAVVLAAAAAIYGGCGKVWVGFRQSALPMPLIPKRPEIMLATAETLIQRQDISAWVCGCGLGTSAESSTVLHRLLDVADGKPLLLDADALNLLAQSPDLANAARRHGRLVITPHPAEAARLLACRTGDIQADRHTAALKLAEQYCATVVLKGRHSLITAPDGATAPKLFRNLSGNPGLAVAGSGDVLSGLTGSLLAQGLPLLQAVCSSVWLHGTAADRLAEQQGGEIGLLAGELPAAVRQIRNRMTA